MGNCFRKNNKNSVINDSTDTLTNKSPPPQVFLYADSSNSLTHYIRFSLLLKPLSLHFIPTSNQQQNPFTLRFEPPSGPTVSGSAETILRFVESKLPHPPLIPSTEGRTTPFRVVELQHRGMKRHVEKVAAWGKEMATRGGTDAVGGGGNRRVVVGTGRMEANKMGKNYEKVLEVLVEHAQMEERILFPILRSLVDTGVCRCVNEEHARDFPIMNGIKEDIKSIGVMNTGTPTRIEALYSLSGRLQTLQDNCTGHFNEEEKNLFPLLEAAELTREQQWKITEQCIDVMQATHSHLFRFFIEGLLPHEAIEYLDLIMTCVNKERACAMLQLLVD